MKTKNRRFSLLASMIVPALFGCGNDLVGEYVGDVRVMEGREEADSPGHSLAEIRQKVTQDKRTLTLMPGGRFRLDSTHSWVEGDWHVEGNKVITVDDTGNGDPIPPGLRVTREFAIGNDGELIHGTSYNLYNLEEIYVKQ